jgi:phosphoadenosine phosphosulfate reductase
MGAAIRQHARPSHDFDARLAQTRALLVRAAGEFAPLKQASSLGAEDVVITHLINSLGLDIPVFVLDTGVLHAATTDLLARTRARSRATVEVFHPQETAVVNFVRREGADAMYRSIALRKDCCGIRKLEPLGRALAGQRAWITGLRREQSGARAEVPLVDTTESDAGGRIKLNPLAEWRWGDVWHYIAEHGVDYNPLHDEFFPSIGCAPCTRAISLGEVVARVDHQQRIRQAAAAESLLGAAQQHQRILAAREQKRRSFGRGRDLAQDEDGLFLQRVQVAGAESAAMRWRLKAEGGWFRLAQEPGFGAGVHAVLRSSCSFAGGVTCKPHSFAVSFSSHHQRPARKSSPRLMARVQGAQPMLGKNSSCSGL